MNTSNKVLNEKLIEHLLRIPFPFSDLLRSQLQVSEVDNESFPDLYRLSFSPKGEAPLFPEYVDMVPLSWQILTSDAPILIQLFLKDGFISELEVIDMGLKEIHWEYIWNSEPFLDICYDFQTVEKLLTSGQYAIYKIRHSPDSIDFGIQSREDKFVASFRGCKIHALPEATEHLQTRFEFITTTDGRVAVISADGRVRFTCQLLFLQRSLML